MDLEFILYFWRQESYDFKVSGKNCSWESAWLRNGSCQMGISIDTHECHSFWEAITKCIPMIRLMLKLIRESVGNVAIPLILSLLTWFWPVMQCVRVSQWQRLSWFRAYHWPLLVSFLICQQRGSATSAECMCAALLGFSADGLLMRMQMCAQDCSVGHCMYGHVRQIPRDHQSLSLPLACCLSLSYSPAFSHLFFLFTSWHPSLFPSLTLAFSLSPFLTSSDVTVRNHTKPGFSV